MIQIQTAVEGGVTREEKGVGVGEEGAVERAQPSAHLTRLLPQGVLPPSLLVHTTSNLSYKLTNKHLTLCHAYPNTLLRISLTNKKTNLQRLGPWPQNRLKNEWIFIVWCLPLVLLQSMAAEPKLKVDR
jgi:hypothetical protein